MRISRGLARTGAILALLFSSPAGADCSASTGVVVERARGSVLVVDVEAAAIEARVTGLGDLSHASVKFSPDRCHAFVFGRDGGLTKIDLAAHRIEARVVQAGNSIGGAVSKDGRIVAVSNYEPGGVRLFAAEDLEPLADIPATFGAGAARSKVVGLVDAPHDRFIFSLFDAGEIWIADTRDPRRPAVQKLTDAGAQPYDALITGDGRYYIAGLFGEDGLALVDLGAERPAVRRILEHYGRGERRLPVYKMPHLEGWARAGARFFLPAVGRHEVLVLDQAGWREAGRIAVHGQPVFVMARPDARQVWVNFAFPDNDTVQVIDTETRSVVRTLQPGKGVLHMEFTPDSRRVWISVRDEDRIDVFDTETFERVAALPAHKPSGIFFATRAGRIGL